MPFVTTADGVRHYYRLTGAAGRPVVMLSHSLGLDHGMWDPQAADLEPHFQVLRYDLRGHGASDAPAGEYSIELLAKDALAIADAAGAATFVFCGLSIGGMIGQWLGAHAPDRITHLVLANTTPRLADPSLMETRRKTVLAEGMTAVTDAALRRFFSPAAVDADAPDVVSAASTASARRTLLATDPVGYAGCCAAVRDLNQVALLGTIRTPTLVISGDRDESMPWDGHGRVLSTSIPGAQAVRLPAAHVSNLERPRSFTAALFDFLLPEAAGTVEAGLPVRRAALGAAHVDRSLGAATDFTRDFQELITRFAWGTIWARPGLDHRTRRLLVLAITAALSRWEEFRLHVRAGLAHELEPCDVKEALLQLAVYGGVPAANTGFQIAAEELENRAVG
jgi:3-oxoadipate enol-lactonase/4-carboxymuconolactone decarboxylase